MSERRSSSVIWIVRMLGAIATGIAIYLALTSLAEAKIVGCGEGSDCNELLASRWSSWLGVPVSFFAAAVYVGIVAASFARRRTPLVVLSVAAGGAAVWFTVLQLGVMKQVCPYCMAVHVCGVMIAGLVLVSFRREAGFVAPVAGLLLTGALIAGQVLGFLPKRAIVSFGGRSSVSKPTSAPATTQVHLRTFYLNGQPIRIDPRAFPMLGPAGAPNLIAVMTDYTCPHCRSLHGMLDGVRKRYEGQVALVLLPVPMNGDCNPRIKQTHILHTNACKLWRIALAVWRADPAKYREFDDWLFEPETARLPHDARAMAAQLVGKERLAKYENDLWVEQTIAEGVKVYAQGDGGQIPKLIFEKDLAAGQVQSEKGLFELLERELGLRP
jgi:uncharacterized membrane protein